MKTKEFITRLGILMPLAFWSVFMFMMLLGIIANSIGVYSGFFCDVYCKLGLTLLAALFLSIIYCQAKSCWK